MNTRKVRLPTLLLGLGLVLSLGLNALLLTRGRTASLADSPIGTYSTVNVTSPAAVDGCYLTLEQSGTYCLYRQSETLEEGRYEEMGQQNCYTLHPDSSTASNTQLIWAGECVYWLSQDGILRFSKFSDIPTYINAS